MNDPMFVLYFWMVGLSAAHLGVLALCALSSQDRQSHEI